MRSARAKNDGLSQRGHYAWIVGPDGCGKSTVADAVARRTDALHLYWRPGFLPMAGSLIGRQAGTTVNTDPHGLKPNPAAKAVLRTAYYALDYVLGYAFMIRPAIRANQSVIVERGWWDMHVDWRRYGLRNPSLIKYLTFLIRKPDSIFVTDVPPHVAHSRKPELSAEEIQRQYQEWYGLRWPDTSVVAVDNTGDSHSTVAEVVAMLGRITR